MKRAHTGAAGDAATGYTKATSGRATTSGTAQRSLEDLQAVLTVVRTFFRGRDIMNGPNTPTWFATLTFKRPQTTTLIAGSTLRSWLRKLNRRNPESRVSAVCWSVELQRRGTAHIHALMAGGRSPLHGHCDHCLTSDLRPFYILNESWWHHHGMARFRPYDDERGGGCAAYVLKYILSDECEDWGLWDAGKDY